MSLTAKGSLRNSFCNFSLRDFCDSNLGIQSKLPRLGAWFTVLRSLFWKILNIVLEYWKLLKLCFIIGKMFGLLGLYVVAKGIISSFSVVLGCLKGVFY